MSAKLKVVPREPLLVERPNAMWEFRGETFDEHVECWGKINEQSEQCLWMQGSVAASLVVRYDEKTTARFAHDVRLSTRRVQEMAQTYRAFEKRERSRILSFHHHTVASRATDPQEAIRVAEDNELSTRELDHWVQTGLLPGEKSDVDAAAISAVADGMRTVRRKAMTDHVQTAMRSVEGLMTSCPDPKFVSDVYNEWMEDLTNYLETAAIEDLKNAVIAAWKGSNHTEDRLAAVTGIPKESIHGVMKAYEREGIFEKIRLPKGQTARGNPGWKWHLKGEPYGSNYSGPARVA